MKKNSLKNYKVDDTSKRGVRYVGVYYTAELPAKERQRNGMVRMAAGFLEILLIFAAIAMNCAGTRTLYVVIPLECILFCAMYYLIGAYTFYRSDDKMEQRTFEKAIENPIQIMTVAIIFNVISCIGQLILIIRKAAEFTDYRDYILFVLILLMLVLHIMMWRYQKKLQDRTRSIR